MGAGLPKAACVTGDDCCSAACAPEILPSPRSDGIVLESAGTKKLNKRLSLLYMPKEVNGNIFEVAPVNNARCDNEVDQVVPAWDILPELVGAKLHVFAYDGEKLGMASLDNTKSKLHWDDGDAWVRSTSPAHSHLPYPVSEFEGAWMYQGHIYIVAGVETGNPGKLVGYAGNL